MAPGFGGPVVALERNGNVSHERHAVQLTCGTAHAEVGTRDPLGVPCHHREEQLPQVLLQTWRKLPEGTEVMEAEPAIRQDENVARVRVGVEYAALENLCEKEPHQRLGKLARILLRAVRGIDSAT